MPDLTRSQFCELTKLPPETMKTMDRRFQLPFSIDQTTWGRGYSLLEAFLMITAKAFDQEYSVGPTRAADIVAALPDVLAPAWARIVETADQMTDGAGKKVAEIMCGRYSVGGLQLPKSIVGTVGEIGRELDAHEQSVSGLICVSASRSLALLFIRCSSQSIEIPDPFLSGPFVYRPRVNAVELGKKSMEKLIAEGVHLQDLEEQKPPDS